MKKSTGVLLGVLGAIVLLFVIIFGWEISTYNGIVIAQTEVEKQASNIQVVLQRRGELIPNLVNTVKGYAAHEEKVIKDVSDARAKLAGAQGVQEQDAANTELNNALSRLLVVVERYPDLKANSEFQNLQVALEGSENRIAIARTDYNKAVQTYNAKIRKFPSSIIAGMFGKKEMESFKGTEKAQSAPEVSF